MIKTRKLTLKQGYGWNSGLIQILPVSRLVYFLYVAKDPSQEPTLRLVTFSQSSFVFQDPDTFEEC